MWASHLHEKLVDRDDFEPDTWIMSAPLYAMRYINDDMNLPEGQAQEL